MPYDHRKTIRRRPARALALALAVAGSGAVLAGCGATSQAAPLSEAAQETRQESVTAPRPPAVTLAPAHPSLPASQGHRLLAGRTIVIDPGHNTGNARHTAEINRKVNIGTTRKECDTTGTATNAGYSEASFTLDVSRRLRDLLTARGAKVVLTHDGDRPWGPCIDERARIGNNARADAVVSVHADGSAAGHRGFHVILPARVHAGGADTSRIVAPSRVLGEKIRDRFARATGTSPANYIGGGTGLDVRGDLGGLNLSTVPKVFVECGNMRDPADARLLTSASWRQKAALGLAEGITTYLKG
ncbi:MULTISPECIES: N-acetylmuramoyl-L-alanine amidase [unclassified Streptomyces]|uniref:N-acetylmuramoyl-L-alanine amidase n=1 Tax=unclassified Streptomyces TaxID=2593676 RepID=UPI0016602105|nr:MULTISPECIES: N-acetylmuramoyl-L-alanine amidase [unclassified Streptomyces]MBD0708875.1 N-acetylmuramoyl-L-alanine amidase [Streptomyces sp. CBMA291]MBD0715974.1 N-acetylmuramoyl-L-alanine amidase [Streptomyces sp. CBMA370]